MTGPLAAPKGRHESVVVCNWLPVQWAASGPVRRRPGSATSALEPIVAARGGAWVGWCGQPDRTLRPFRAEDMRLYPVPLSGAEVAEYLQGQCQSTISPLYHDAVVHPVFDRRWCQAYQQVNRRFAEAAAEVAAPGALVWVYGYHLQLVPALLRRLRPDLLIGFFLHIPFPPPELFTRLPLRDEIIHGLLGADVVGFQSARAAENFLTLTRWLPGPRGGDGYVEVAGRRVTVGAFPQSVDVAQIEKLAADETVRVRCTGLRAELGNPRTVLLAVDRLDPAKGIEQRLAAYAELLDEGRLDPAHTVLVQLAAPQEHPSPGHRTLRERVEQQVGRINGVHGQVGWPAVHYQHRLLEPADLVALYLTADVLLSTPLRDGMNLTAKEYVAARTDHTGTVVLSEFTGTAADLPQAFTVNPHDIDAMNRAIHSAVHADPADLQPRMSQMRRHLLAHDVRLWAARFLSALGQCATPPAHRAGARLPGKVPAPPRGGS